MRSAVKIILIVGLISLISALAPTILLNTPDDTHTFSTSFNFSSNVSDDDTIDNATLYVWNNDVEGYAFFDGTGHIDAGNDPSLRLNDNLTVSAWIYATNLSGVTTRRDVVTKGTTNSYEWALTIRDSSLNTSQFVVWNTAGSNYLTVSGFTTLNENQWYHLIGSLNESGAFLYVDGNLDASDLTTNGVQETDGTAKIYIGARQTQGSDVKFQGRIDDVRVYNASLTQRQIRRIFNESSHSSSERGQSIPVLLYHRIGETAPSDTFVTIENFEKQMAWLNQSGFETITDVDYYNWTLGKFTLPEKPVMIFSDDGWLSWYANATPIMNNYSFKSVLSKITNKSRELSNDWNLYMNWTETKNFSDDGHSIASHSVTHPHFLTLSETEARDELSTSRDEIEGNISITPISFVFPYHESSQEIVDWCSEEGYKMCWTQGATPHSSSLYIYNFNDTNFTLYKDLKRITISNITTQGQFEDVLRAYADQRGHWNFEASYHDGSGYNNHGTNSGTALMERYFNFTSLTGTSANVGFLNGVSEGIWKYWFEVFDNSSTQTLSSNRTLTVDTTNPVVTLISPRGGEDTDGVLDILFNVTDTNDLPNCTVNTLDTYPNAEFKKYIFTSIDKNVANSVRVSNVIESPSLRINVTCADEAGNVGESYNYFIKTVQGSNSGGGGSGGSGGGWKEEERKERDRTICRALERNYKKNRMIKTDQVINDLRTLGIEIYAHGLGYYRDGFEKVCVGYTSIKSIEPVTMKIGEIFAIFIGIFFGMVFIGELIGG